VLKNTKQALRNPTEGNKSQNLATSAAIYNGLCKEHSERFSFSTSQCLCSLSFIRTMRVYAWLLSEMLYLQLRCNIRHFEKNNVWRWITTCLEL